MLLILYGITLLLLFIYFICYINSYGEIKLNVGTLILLILFLIIPVLNIAVVLGFIIDLQWRDFVPIDEIRPKLLQKLIKFLNKEIKI